MPAKTIQAPNLARSAIAPEIRATVMIAKVAWNPANASMFRSGPPSDDVSNGIRPAFVNGLPSTCGMSQSAPDVNDIEYP